MSDWQDATDPVPPRRELTDAEKKRRLRFIERARRDRAALRSDPEAPSYRVDADFDEMGA